MGLLPDLCTVAILIQLLNHEAVAVFIPLLVQLSFTSAGTEVLQIVMLSNL